MSSGADRSEEQVARAVVGQLTGAVVVRTDDRGAPAGTVDAQLEYSDGRTGALEISTLGLADEFAAESRIEKLGGQLPMPGRWKWVVRVSDPRELKRMQAIYASVILTCEAHNVASIGGLPREVVDADKDLQWLSTRSSSDLFGIQIPEGAQDTSGFIDLVYRPIGTYGSPGPDQILSTVNASLARKPLARRVTKLAKAEAEERHLFLHVAVSGLDEYSYARLMLHAATLQDVRPQAILPLRGDPDLPEPISHLWLYTGWFNTVSRWTRGQGWDHLQVQ